MVREGLGAENPQRIIELDRGIKTKVEELVEDDNVLHLDGGWHLRGTARYHHSNTRYAATTELLKKWQERPVIPSIQGIFPFITRHRLGEYMKIRLELDRDSKGEVDTWKITLGSLPDPMFMFGLQSANWRLTLVLSNERRPKLSVSDRIQKKFLGLSILDTVLEYEEDYPATIKTLEVFNGILLQAKPQQQFIKEKREEGRVKLGWSKPNDSRKDIV